MHVTVPHVHSGEGLQRGYELSSRDLQLIWPTHWGFGRRERRGVCVRTTASQYSSVSSPFLTLFLSISLSLPLSLALSVSLTLPYVPYHWTGVRVAVFERSLAADGRMTVLELQQASELLAREHFVAGGSSRDDYSLRLLLNGRDVTPRNEAQLMRLPLPISVEFHWRPRNMKRAAESSEHEPAARRARVDDADG